jgi:hypothetical protein
VDKIMDQWRGIRERRLHQRFCVPGDSGATYFFGSPGQSDDGASNRVFQRPSDAVWVFHEELNRFIRDQLFPRRSTTRYGWTIPTSFLLG